jgi:hypothetical protein
MVCGPYGDGKRSCAVYDSYVLTGPSQGGSVSKVDVATPMPLIYKTLFPSISTFETPPRKDNPNVFQQLNSKLAAFVTA